MPVYNDEKYIKKAVRSIQNQNMDDIEIILVNDFSSKNTLSYIEELQKDDPRIKIINNKKNMGTLYSRSIGALYAKGKYIFPLDSDDMFLDYDVFNTIYNAAKEDDYDIVEFRGIMIRVFGENLLNGMIQNTFFTWYKKDQVLFQPELGNFPIQPSKDLGKFDIIDNFLWNKCIKTDIYK